jgi:hypothetical protein
MGHRTDDRLLDAPMIPVACKNCGAEVLARKSSWAQTSVQWNAQALSRCPHRQAFSTRAPIGDAVFLGCPDLRDSILESVSQGRLPVLDDSRGTTADPIG